jgi:hypothetical protein
LLVVVGDCELVVDSVAFALLDRVLARVDAILGGVCSLVEARFGGVLLRGGVVLVSFVRRRVSFRSAST